MFDDQSRYAGLPTRTMTLADGRQVAFVTRRFVPPAASYITAGAVTTTDSDRLDLVAARQLGSPAGFYMIADANEAMHPLELTAEAGRKLLIPLPRSGAVR